MELHRDELLQLLGLLTGVGAFLVLAPVTPLAANVPGGGDGGAPNRTSAPPPSPPPPSRRAEASPVPAR